MVPVLSCLDSICAGPSQSCEISMLRDRTGRRHKLTVTNSPQIFTFVLISYITGLILVHVWYDFCHASVYLGFSGIVYLFIPLYDPSRMSLFRSKDDIADDQSKKRINPTFIDASGAGYDNDIREELLFLKRMSHVSHYFQCFVFSRSS